ncbi:Gar1/Naf1 family protein [Thermococcus sp. Bubb.Bath]|uniref:Gar1/Naf1 family protein n=1 Tax=Thermococcus sp. Bubb.Bath TaxID=1638242 RepID=UPI0014392A41|nr:Gar1/Naf1 family protein [Thermococcus sp. Bubb.Bath]NJF25467.1 H/ACA RNA-protein complex protein Gar1 [Thermococcus sp. Bubb.Bath]
MKKLGKVSHYAKQGFLILRTTRVPNLNDRIVDKNLVFVGTVKDVFGPVNAPYVAIKPRVKNPTDYIGSLLYVDDRRVSKGNTRDKRRKDSRKKRPAPRRRG